MVKTRQQLRFEGVELEGVIVADWFRLGCDGCSAKIAKNTSIIKELTSGCIVHDAEHTMIPIVCPIGSKEAKALRKDSDRRLYRNCRTILGARGKRPWRRFWLSRAVYVMVRMFGTQGVTPVSEKAHRMPRTQEQFAEFWGMLKHQYVGVNTRMPYAKIQMELIRCAYVDNKLKRDTGPRA